MKYETYRDRLAQLYALHLPRLQQLGVTTHEDFDRDAIVLTSNNGREWYIRNRALVEVDDPTVLFVEALKKIGVTA